uniref:Uncharacterized protein n=1 Tax=Pseudo-nitzschia australis TaxID=44445 RepID=A0A7S4ALN0_9STRA|mmetsp:Transcript_13885/g.29237  ORF Transcript_13885/g.29237 Transcript_13885/m.29237 type:complete len:432 (-) Transcript_13885:149-1444(-)|eukprot:CAMPEP_0168186922 /NCGR_PEP_ID=MMETSP0139_2-20121125/14713_1 /TAXON_ID=44445 /ORGANISM="Pseudo-nitzschia australis, Strain 10249 10 AB" /LENGTH=431 /DNA_ID=CAMNT_0008109007 /DNA_START=270 /DNA_END=1565 /DNA_ORIENTATION=+
MIRIRTKLRTSSAACGPVTTALLAVAYVATILVLCVSSFQIQPLSAGTKSKSSSAYNNRSRRNENTTTNRNRGPTRSMIEGKQSTDTNDQGDEQKRDKGLLRQEKSSGLLRLAKLSLQDYEWRVGLFKDREADRKVEESLARMMGDEASYVRPMDASENSIGPLGLWEKESVEWLQQVIDEEARRAREIVRLGGILVRPMDATTGPGQIEDLGPLGVIERRVVDFVDSIRQSERERSKSMVLRPKDVEASKRGPLGEAELRASEAIREILRSERIRMQESRRRDGIVRPIDIPGPLGELEMAVLEVVRAEEKRKIEIKENNSAYLVRPMNAKTKGPLGELEAQATEAVKRLTDEEKQRVRNIQRYLDENRPMQQSERSALGVLETVVVGIVRAPILFYQIFNRVKDLLQSEAIDGRDAEILRQEQPGRKEK